jgi:hypothetical protein
MNTLVATAPLPLLPASMGRWRALYWEPVLATGERFCFAIAYEWQGTNSVENILRPGILQALYGGGGDRAVKLLDRVVRLCKAHLSGNDLDTLPNVLSAMTGIYPSETEVAHVNDVLSLLQVAKLMSSSLASLGEIDEDASEAVTSEQQAATSKQFATRVRDLVVAERIDLMTYFQREATLMASKRPVRFGFLSDSFAAHFGLLQLTSLSRHVRYSRGLITELAIAAKQSGRRCALYLGHPPLTSATLTDKERCAISEYLEELELEASEFSVTLKAADNDKTVSEAILEAA